MESEATHPDLRRLFWVGPLAIAAAIAAVLAVRVVAFAVVALPADYPPLTWSGLIIFTAVLVTAAVLVFAVVARRATDPAQQYRRIALAALFLSFVPDLLLPYDGQGGTWPAAIVLMIMHAAAWWPTVRILTALGLKRRS